MIRYSTSQEWHVTYKQTPPPARAKKRIPLAEGFYLYEREYRDPKTGSSYGFAPSQTLLDKYHLSGKNILEIVNELCILVEAKKDELPAEDWQHLHSSLKQLMIKHEDGSLLYHLINNYGAEAINYWAWVRFSMDCDWYVCIETFRLMPTDMLEEYAKKNWADRTKNFTDKCFEAVMEQIGHRKDIYGAHSLPAKLVQGLLFA